MSKFDWSPLRQASDVEIKEDNLIHDGFFKLKQMHLRHRFFSGEWSPWLVREQIFRCDAAAVLLYDPDKKMVVLTQQLRVGLVFSQMEQSPWMLEIVAGLLEKGESPEQTVLREAKEEAGATIASLIKIGEFYNTPGGFSEKTFLYCGIVASALLGGINGVLDEHEDIFVHCLPVSDVIDALEKGIFVTSASTVIALQWLKMKLLNGENWYKNGEN